MKIIFIAIFVSINFYVFAQNKTDVSLFLRKDSTTYLREIHSKSGDLFNELGHHGPAIENEWMGIRLYFDPRVAIDIYSKITSGLELRKTRWYSSPKQYANGLGGDFYKVGNTIGLGGVRLWDGEKVVLLNPVSSRYARVFKQGTTSSMEMLSEDIPYKGKLVDILIRVTVYSGIRYAKVEAFALCDEEVEFVTGINYHKGQKIVSKNNYTAVWGFHPEDIAPGKIEIGSAILFNPKRFRKILDDGTQHLLISNPCKYLEHWITIANARETHVNTCEKFIELIENTELINLNLDIPQNFNQTLK